MFIGQPCDEHSGGAPPIDVSVHVLAGTVAGWIHTATRAKLTAIARCLAVAVPPLTVLVNDRAILAALRGGQK